MQSLQLSLKTAQVPLEWESANVIPTFKNSDETQIENYRPISILEAAAKITERILFNSLLQQHSLLTQHQTGYQPNHSTNQDSMTGGRLWMMTTVGALFLDLKVFDTIDHVLLLKKMQPSLVLWEEQN